MGNPESYKANLHPWIPERDPLRCAVLGKSQEELGELGSAVARAQIQGIEGRDEETGYPNKEWMEDEIADVYAILSWLLDTFPLDRERIKERYRGKLSHFVKWGALIEETVNGPASEGNPLGERPVRPPDAPGDGE